MNDHQELQAQLQVMTLRAKNAEAENKTLIDRWMLQKMQDAERLNEVLSCFCSHSGSWIKTNSWPSHHFYF